MLTPEQLEIRSHGIGGSEIAAVVGINPWSGPVDVWLRKTGRDSSVVSGHNIERGNHLEAGIIAWYAEREARTVVPCDTLVHPEYEIVRATPDGISSSDGTPDRIIEVKSPSWHTAHHWGAPGGDDVPDYYVPQLHWEMAVTGLRQADMAALLNDDLGVYHVGWDQELFEALLEIAERFWHDHVVADKIPDPDGTDSAWDWIQGRYPKLRPDVIDASEDAEAKAVKLRAIKEQTSELEAEGKVLKQELAMMIGAAEGMRGNFGKIYYKHRAGKPSWKTIATDLAGGAVDEKLIAKYTSAPARVFAPYWKRG